MQIPDNNPNQSNLSNGPPAGPAFVRKRKTHLNDTVIAVLRSLPRAARLDQNKLITSRNQQRAVGRAYRESDPSCNETGERYSSDESLCSISDNDEDTAGSSRLDGLPLGDLSPNSLRALASKLLKRKKDADESDDDTDSAITKAKKQMTNRKAEVVIKAGESFMPGFNDLHYALSYNNCYIPLSLFTNANLAVINREALTLPKTSINPHATKGKKSYLLDIEKFESKYGSEAKLTQLEWVEGASNFVGFLESFGDSGTAQVTRWKNHFGFFESRPDAINIFPAIRALDIRFRKDYISKPFAFDTSLYDSELQKTITQTELERMREESRIELQNMRDHFSNKGSATLGFNNKPKPNSRPFLRQPNNTPFQGRAGGDPSTAVCVICAKKGHLFSTCNSTTFDNGSPTTCKADGPNIVSAKGKSHICRSWNVRGVTTSACTNHPQDKRLYICSFCGDKSHHAFSWTCRRDPSRPVQ